MKGLNCATGPRLSSRTDFHVGPLASREVCSGSQLEPAIPVEAEIGVGADESASTNYVSFSHGKGVRGRAAGPAARLPSRRAWVELPKWRMLPAPSSRLPSSVTFADRPPKTHPCPPRCE